MYLEKCPVCNGKGTVPNGFYTTTNDFYYSTTTGNEICRSCYGKGYISIPTNDIMDTVDSSNIGINYVDNMKFDSLNIGDIVYVESNTLKDYIKEQYDVDVSKYDYIQCKIWALGVKENDEVSVYLFKGTKDYYCNISIEDVHKCISGDAKVYYYDDEDYQIGDKVYYLHGICVEFGEITLKFKSTDDKDLYNLQLSTGNVVYGISKERIYKHTDLIEKYMDIEKELTSSDNKHTPKFNRSQNLILNPAGLELFNKSITDLNLSDEVKVELIDYLYYDELNSCEWYYIKIPEIYNIVCVFPDTYISIKNDTIVIRNLEDTIPLMNSSDYKDRFVAEYEQLRIRMKKLKYIIDKYNEGTLEFELSMPIVVYENQYLAMEMYLNILKQRAIAEEIYFRSKEVDEDSNCNCKLR